MSTLKLAVQKSGRLHEKSLSLIRACGIKFANGTGKLKTMATNFPVEILFLRDDDIPPYVEQGVADIGIIGLSELLEKERNVRLAEQLGFALCRMCLAVPKEVDYPGLSFFDGKKIATSYPGIISRFFSDQGIRVQIEPISGSVEIATSIGLADAIFDIVSTGSTLWTNGLKEVETIVESEAVLIASQSLNQVQQRLLDKLLFRMQAVRNGSDYKYILLNAPKEAIPAISRIIPGMKSPTILPLADEGWCSLHSVVREDAFWEVIDQLKGLGAQGILVAPIEKMVL